MPIARYPRLGERIAPQSLAEFLDGQVDRAISNAGDEPWRLRDLDGSAWGSLGTATCLRATNEVVAAVRRQISAIGKLQFSALPEQLEWESLTLGVRAYNALRGCLNLPRPARLSGWAVAELMKIKAFGVTSLLDLLTSLEDATGFPTVFEVTDGPRAESVPGFHGMQRELSSRPNSLVADQDERASSLRSAVGLMKLEQVLGPDLVHARDPRFGVQLRAVDSACADTAELLEVVPKRLGRQGAGLEARLRAIQTLSDQVASARELGPLVELESIVKAICTDSNAKAVLRFWGWDGRGGATLQQVGDERHVTRERVRQITQKAQEQLEARAPIFAPATARALAIVQGLLPATAAVLVAALAREGLVPKNCQLRFLTDLGRLLGRPTPFRFVEEYGTFVSTRTGERLVSAIHRQALRLAGKYGAACVEDVCDALREDTPRALNPELASRLLRTRQDLAWLDNEHRWFCKQPPSWNPLLNRVRKVLSVARQVRAAELRGGLERHFHLKGSVPPKTILLKLCTYDDALEVQGDVVALRDGHVLEAELSAAEKTIRSVLVTAGSVMRRSELERDCLRAGMSRPSFTATLTYSPILIRYAHQVYGLRGMAIAPGAVESLQVPRARGRLLQDSGWVGDGRVRFVYKLTESCLGSGIVTIPASFSRFLQGDFSLVRLGTPVGTLRCRGGQAWGLAPLLRRVGAEAGDTLTLDVDLQKAEAQASVTTETPEDAMAESEQAGQI
jgi:hypothetical protein